MCYTCVKYLRKEQKSMNITEFSESRSIKVQAVSNYISRHPELFEGHTTKEGNLTILDDAALELLDKKYPLPQPIQIINGIDSEEYQRVLNELNQKNNLIIQMQQELSDVKLKLVEETSQKLFLAEKNENKDKTIAEQNKSLETANNEILRLKNRNLINRIFNK